MGLAKTHSGEGGGLTRVSIVSGDFVTTGGMDRANLALASYLARQGNAVDIVAHRVAADLSAYSNVAVHTVRRPMGRHAIGDFLLRRAGARIGREVLKAGGHAIANGGNCDVGDVNWVHYVHAAYRAPASGSAFRQWKSAWHHRRSRRTEEASICAAKLVITNSDFTKRCVYSLGVEPARVRTIYYGIDAETFRPADRETIAATRAELGWSDRPMLAFVGALGDERKGFATLFEAFESLCRQASWDADLVVIGRGASLDLWRERVRVAGLADRIRFLGFRNDVPRVLAACDCLVSPTQYEAFGLGVLEAMCLGLPVIVSEHAGVAELLFNFPTTSVSPPVIRSSEQPVLMGKHVADLLLFMLDSEELQATLIEWRQSLEAYRTAAIEASAIYRRRSWDDMAAEIVAAMEAM